MKRFLLIVVAALLALPGFSGELRLAGVFSDNMVLQRETDCPVWGWAAPGARVSVSASWSRKAVSAVADADGRWRVSLRTPEAGGPYTMTVRSGKERLERHDILCGEVWVCSGQSNMQMPVAGFSRQVVEGSREAILRAPAMADRIRIFKMDADTTQVPQADIKAEWKKASGNMAAYTSAVGYFFAERLTESLGIPVGIIVNAWVGSRIAAWMEAETVESLRGTVPDGQIAKTFAERNGGAYPVQVQSLWNGRMLPVAGYAARGFLWYQGESDIEDLYYDRVQAAMVARWREKWGRGEMPFLFVTLAPYGYGEPAGEKRPRFVEVQLRSLQEIPSCYAAVTESLGKENSIHPPKKREIADQFAILALDKVYGREMATSSFPYPVKYTFGDGKAVVEFGNAPMGVGDWYTEIKGFELAGADRVFHPARATAGGNWSRFVTVTCPEVPEPVAVRYAFHNYVESNLFSTLGVPVPCFRSDDW